VSDRVLFVENGDSFSYNVLDALPVPRRDAVVLTPEESLAFLRHEEPRWAVIGPGPFDPREAGLLPVVATLAAREIPTLGICLGHQAIGMHFGAMLRPVEPHHGVRDAIRLEPSRLLPHFRGTTTVMRYHSLALVDPLPPELRLVARGSDGTIMAVEHESLPMLGLQFHPDSFATVSGEAMVRDFVRAVFSPGAEAHP
jgi:anthranilate synthase/aminodeoxychorismate synthase-like glutamine amidotransferase